MDVRVSDDIKERIVHWYYQDDMTMEEIRDLAHCSFELITCITTCLTLCTEEISHLGPESEVEGENEEEARPLEFYRALNVRQPSRYQ